MRILVLICLIALGAAASLPLTAARADDCDNAMTQAAMNECSDKAYKASDAELNKLYRQVDERLKDDADPRRLLISAQRAWVNFRDAECKFSTSRSSGGSIHPMVVSMCLDDLTKKRVEDFKQALDCPEGDVTCSLPPAN